MACKGLEEVKKVQADFYQKALEDYRVEATRMIGLMLAPMVAVPGGGVQTTKRSYDDVPV